MNSEHYFDWAATSPSDENILREALEESMIHWGNPSSLHEAGTDARKALEDARKLCAGVLGVKPETVYFTSGGTEGDHITLLSVLTRPQKGSVVISAIEHPAVREMAKMITNLGWKVISVKPDKTGAVSAQAVIDSLQDDTAFVSIMAVNNETGAVQPVYEISDALTKACAGKRRPFFHVDCVQAAGKIPLDLNYPGIDSASFSAHKICGPRGIGILYLSKTLNSFLKGGGQEKNIRSGTENLFGAIAFSKCLEKYYIHADNQEMMKKYEAQKKLTAAFISKLKKIGCCTIVPEVRGTDEEIDSQYSPWVLQAAFKNIPGQVMVRALNSEGFYISTGSACSTGKNSRPVLEAMNVFASVKETAVRFSFGPLTTEKAMDELYEAVKKITGTFNK